MCMFINRQPARLQAHADDRKPVGYTLKEGFGNWSKRALSWLADKLTVAVTLA